MILAESYPYFTIHICSLGHKELAIFLCLLLAAVFFSKKSTGN